MRLLGVALLARLALALVFAAATPLWEHYDELNHFFVARFRGGVSEERPDSTLPPQYVIYSQFSQPPLYYMFSGWLLRTVDDGTPLPVIANPEPFCAYPQANHFYLHDLPEEGPLQLPYRGIWLIRALNVLVGVASVAVVWLAARILWPYYPVRAWLASFLFAVFSPAIALTAWFNNDAPLMLVGAILIVLLGRWQQQGLSWRLMVGVVAVWLVGIGIKLTMLAVLPAIAFVAIGESLRRSQERRLRQIAWISAGIGVLVVLVFFANLAFCGRGLCRTHRPITAENLAVVAGDFVGRYMPEAIGELLRTLGAPSVSSAYPPRLWMVMVTLATLLLGINNALLRTWEARHERRAMGMLFMVVAGAVGLGLVRVWWLKVGFFPARYVAVALPALMLLLSVGYHLLVARLHRFLGIMPIVVFVVISVGALYVSYRPLWNYPERHNSLPDDALPVNMMFENGFQVAGAVFEGDMITLYFSVDRPIADALAVEIALLDETGYPHAHCEMLAGHPNWATHLWQPGELVVQRATLENMAISRTPVFVRIRVAPLLNTVYLDNQPDYSRELRVLNGSNLVPYLP